MLCVLEHHLQNRVEGFLGAVALALLHLDGLAGRLHFDSIEVQMEAGDLAESVGCLHELSISLQLSMTGDLRADDTHHQITTVSSSSQQKRLS